MSRPRVLSACPAPALAAFALLQCLAFAIAGPLGAPPAPARPDTGLDHPNPDVSSCTVGSVTYAAGAAVPGDGACDNCTCAAGGRVRCARTRCEPRPGCKALHRPDHCCPTYQCECEQDGRRYGNGEKLVDPEDPCRVCYCQGGEVVCRRIACFRRDDCRPRHVPGRCCPEYDHCPLRGISTVPGSTAMLNVTSTDTTAVAAAVPPDAVKQEITIKEITPVSEIPVITEVKIKEVLPTPSVDNSEYETSRAPPTPSEPAAPPAPVRVAIDVLSSDSMHPPVATDTFPSKMSSSLDSRGSAGGDAAATQSGASARPAPVIDDDEPSLFEHNPAFPPLPDDLSVLTEREDETAVEHQTSDVPRSTAVILPPTPTVGTGPPVDVAKSEVPDASVLSIPVKDDAPGESRSVAATDPSNVLTTTTADVSDAAVRSEESMRDVAAGRAPHRARPAEALPTSSTVDADGPTTVSTAPLLHDTTTRIVETSRDVPSSPVDARDLPATTVESAPDEPPATSEANILADDSISTGVPAASNSPANADVPASTASHSDSPATLQPIDFSSAEPLPTRLLITVGAPTDVEPESESTERTSLDDSDGTETVTEDGTTDAPSRVTIRPPRPNKNVLADLIDLVGDVASIGERTDGPHPSAAAPSAPSSPTAIAESEEFILVNAGYKSKNSNWNSNSITEEPDKTPPRPIAVELEDDEPEGATDAPRPGDRAEPTTRPPLIDRVTPGAQPAAAHRDIEIITQAYVPGIARRPTKVVQGEPEDDAAPAPPAPPPPAPSAEPPAH